MPINANTVNGHKENLMTRMHTKKIQGGEIQAISKNGKVIAIKVLDQNGTPYSWAFTENQTEQHIKLMQNLIDRGEA